MGSFKKAIRLYNERMKQLNPDYKQINGDENFYKIFENNRHDPVLVEIYRELGNEFNGKWNSSKIITIPKKYKNHYVISEYDGLENVTIDKDKYKVDTIKEIILDNISSDEKINKINDILSEK